jgi:putative phosphoesterase
MRVGVLSDSHSNARKLRAAANLFLAREVDTVVHCGDICSPQSVSILEQLQVHWVFGNCDFDQLELRSVMHSHGHSCHGLAGSVQLGERRLGFTHGHHQLLLSELIAGGEHDYVCHGHTHTRRDEMVHGVRVLNPGALANANPATVLILETESDKAEWLKV